MKVKFRQVDCIRKSVAQNRANEKEEGQLRKEGEAV